MKLNVFALSVLIAMGFSAHFAHAQGAPVLTPATAGGPAVSTVVTPSLAAAPVSVSVAAPAAPPKWAEDLMVTAEKMPVVGPLVSKALLYLGILSSLLTALIAFLLAGLSTLSGAFSWAGFATSAAKIDAFQNGKIVYWLKYFSMFNAKQPVEQATASSVKAA